MKRAAYQAYQAKDSGQAGTPEEAPFCFWGTQTTNWAVVRYANKPPGVPSGRPGAVAAAVLRE